MTQRLTIKLPNSSITVESDNPAFIAEISDYCRKNFDAHHATEDDSTLFVSDITVEQLEELHNLFNW